MRKRAQGWQEMKSREPLEPYQGECTRGQSRVKKKGVTGRTQEKAENQDKRNTLPISRHGHAQGLPIKQMQRSNDRIKTEKGKG